MNDIMFEVLTTIVAIAAGAAWYKEFIARRKIEADLAVEKQKRKLDETQHKLDTNKTAYDAALDRLNADALDKLVTDTNGSILAANPGGHGSDPETDPEVGSGSL